MGTNEGSEGGEDGAGMELREGNMWKELRRRDWTGIHVEGKIN